MLTRHTLAVGLLLPLSACALADEPKKVDAKLQGDGHAVTFKPGDPKAAIAPRFSPKGTQIELKPTALPKVDGKDHLVGRIPLGAKAVRGEGQLIALARSEAGKPYDLLFVDTNLDGQLTDEKAITTKPNLTRNNWWSSFDGTLKAVHAAKGPDATTDYPVGFWAVVEKPDETPKILRNSRRGFAAGTVTIDGGEYTVLVSDGDNDGVIGDGDYWTLGRTKDDDPLAGKDWRRMPDFSWAGGKAWKLVMDGTSGKGGKVYPFAPGMTQEEDALKRDTYKVDRDAPRAEKPVAFETDYETALKGASTDKKPVFVKFETDWCGPCAIMSKLVFTAKDVAAAADGVVCVKVDGDKRKDLVEKYKVTSYPTGVLLGADGKEIGRYNGYQGVKAMADKLKTLKK